ncbi:MAG: SDR family oxidoreductase [Acidobacteria bacterium]|nr:SDR family oxidoreductase [Acidobacteriota bacterium]
MSDFLKGKTAVITGGSRGLGKAMAVALAAEGVRIALVARDEAAMTDVAETIRKAGGEASCFKADVTDETAVATLEKEVLLQYGTVDILINNAGINIRKPIHEFTLEEWRRVQDTNVTSVFLMCRAFVPHMKGKGYGRIFNMTSIMSHISLPGRAAYSSSKAALLGLTRAVALELATEGITVVGISPGPFATEMNLPLMNNPEANAKFLSSIPVGRWGDVNEIGKLTVFLCSEGAGFITGTDILIDGGWCAQ